MRLRKIIFIILSTFIILIGIFLINIYSILPINEAKPKIQTFLDEKYNNKFKIVSIEKHYSQDLFHQPNGYKIILKDEKNIKFGNILIQFNDYQKQWVTMGIDIEEEYNKVNRNENQTIP